MTPSELASLCAVTVNTVRNWTREYSEFLSPAATPRTGQPRKYSLLDQRVLFHVATLRRAGLDGEAIRQRLGVLKFDHWSGLPDLPDEFRTVDLAGKLDVVPSERRARELAEVQVLQGEVTRLQNALQAAETRVQVLQDQINEIQASERATASQLHSAELQLAQARGEAAALRAQLGQYAIGDRQIPIVILVAAVAVLSVFLVLVIFLVAKLLL